MVDMYIYFPETVVSIVNGGKEKSIYKAACGVRCDPVSLCAYLCPGNTVWGGYPRC